MSHSVVIVESPAKAKTIEGYLGPGYTVLASYGHVRDLPSKDGSIDTQNNFHMTWELSSKSQQHISNIKKAVKNATTLYLATDPDREGEAISWHVSEILKSNKQNMAFKRIVFHEITANAIKQAIQNPRDIDQNLVDAYLARRALDYLVGFSISPILWRKLPGSRSAGRVQSVALRLIVDREEEIESFISQDYWTIAGNFQTPKHEDFTTKLTHLPNGKKLEKFDIKSTQEAKDLVSLLAQDSYHIAKVETKKTKRNPTAPFTTSTLQQEASRKLGFGASKTMQVAQKLYEGISLGGEVTGLITYMRTDSVTLSQDAITQARQFIESDYGKAYLPTAPRAYKSKAKNAQEAHEAIRPARISLKPQDIQQYLSADQYKLYDLIWKKTLASQMESAIFDQVSADLKTNNNTNQAIFRATGSTLVFDGFLKAYREGIEHGQVVEKDENQLPELREDSPVQTNSIKEDQHATQPPPRYTEASLVKQLEELGIGRPSTYAPLLQVLQDRSYVTLDKKQFNPSDRGRIVTSFLKHFFERYIAYDFTADMEEELDSIAEGHLSWLKSVGTFWEHFKPDIDKMEPIRITEVIETLEKDLNQFLFAGKPEGERPCPKCSESKENKSEIGQLHLKLGKFGAFLGCSNYPDCKYTKPIGEQNEQSTEYSAAGEPKALGNDTEDSTPITLRKGPYGWYLQWDKAEEPTQPTEDKKGKKKKGATPKRVSIPNGFDLSSIDINLAMKLKRLPFEIGNHPETNLIIKVGIGRFGPYVQHDGVFASIPKAISFLDISLDEAVELLEKKKQRVAAPKAKKVVKKAVKPKATKTTKAKKDTKA